jgi:RNA polymerase sigma factor (sigma-70 family)
MALEWGTGPEMIELSDERLALRRAQGDRRAFEAIYRRYHQDLYRFCLAMLGSPHDAQDTLQNTMVKVLRALPGEERQIKLKPWLYRIARNEAIETLRRRRDRVEPEPEQAAPTAAQIAERAEDRERLRGLFADLERLPSRQRGALVMRELSGLSFEEIAKAFETTPATARQTVYEARLSLRQMEEGREMRCEAVTRALSEADGRVRRRRDLTAHLHNCASCRAFAAEIDERRSKLAALAPLPLAASSGVLHGVLSGKASGALAGGTAAGGTGGGGSLAGATASGAGKAVAGSAIAKSAAAVAVAALVGVSAAGRAGLIDVPLANHGGKPGEAPSSSAAIPDASARVREKKRAASRSLRKQAAARGHLTDARVAAGDAGRAAASPQASAHSNGGEAGTPSTTAGHSPHGQSSPHGHRPASGKPTQTHRGPSPASSRGQGTAAAHKSPHANPAPGSDSRRSRPAHPEAPAAKTKAPTGQARTPAAPPAEAEESGSGHAQGVETPDSLEQPASGANSPDGGG